MNQTSGVLALVDDGALRDEVDRVAAAVGVRVVHFGTSATPSRRMWLAAAAVVLDESAAAGCAGTLPRRQQVILLSRGEATDELWQVAISVGAQQVLRLPAEEDQLVTMLSDAGESADGDGARGDMVAVVGGRGGSGASVFAAALALTAPDALLVDVDPWGGGVDLLLGIERLPGLRWPDLALEGGRLSLSALRDALPAHSGVSVLSCTRRGADVPAGALGAIVDAGLRGGATVVCDLPRRLTAAAETALDAADLVVVVGQCDVRSCASIAAMAPAVTAINPNVGLVVRGPSPGGLRSAEAATVVGLPLLAKVRAEPRLAENVERGGLRLPRRSALRSAARRVLVVLHRQPASVAA